jgi:hypothetical protein
VLRTAAGELLSTDDIAGRVIVAKGFNADDEILRAAIREQVGSTVKPRTGMDRSKTLVLGGRVGGG